MESAESYSALAEQPPTIRPEQIQETAFEKRRGISRIEIRKGFAQIYVHDLAEPIMESRLRVLGAVADAGISIDFLKLTADGMSFIVPNGDGAKVKETLSRIETPFDLLENRDIVLVHAVNMRDGEALIADVMKRAIECEVRMQHVTDMHDRMLMVVDAADSEELSRALSNLEGRC